MSTPRFTPDQLAAVDVGRRHLDACVVAGPGSGKTTVLVEYFRRLVAAGIDPLRILAITFTEKAAGNMRKKLGEAFHEDTLIRARLERAWVSTVHGFCARLLRENAVFAGVDPEFHVADERESWRLQHDSIAAAMEEVFAAHPEGVRALIRALSSPDFEEAVLSAYDAMRGAGVRVEDLAGFPVPRGAMVADIRDTLEALRKERPTTWNPGQKQQLASALETAGRIVHAHSSREALIAAEAFACNLNKCKRGNQAYNLLKRLKDLIEESRYSLVTECYAAERRLLLDIFHRFDRLYRSRKRDLSALDFADLEEYAVRLLEDHPDTRARLQAQFDHILMDEFQDTNGQQAKLLRLIRPPDRFYAVGDINQSIFGFRHAEPEGFREYRDEVERTRRRLVELTDNFRSRPEILSAVETITHGIPGIEPRPLIAGLEFDTPKPFSVETVVVAGGQDLEARWVARRILELDAPYKDVAVLVRNTEVLADFTAAFDEAGIPYVVNRGKGFYETREINDLTHLLRVIANPRDEISLAAVLRSPLVGVSDEALLQLRTSGNIGRSLAWLTAETARGYSPADARALLDFRTRLHEWRLRREYVTFDRLLLAAIDECGYTGESGARGAANIDKFLAQARDASGRMSLDQFVEELALVRESNPREPDAPPEDSADAVKIMTVHSAKGLEFPIVFVAALHKGVNTDLPVVAFSRHHGLGARWRIPATRKDKDDLFQHAIRDEFSARETAESNRLLYVAMTRAEDHLVLSFCINDRKPANWAATIVRSLALDLDRFRDETLTVTAPDGEPWSLRLLVTDQPPPASAAPRPSTPPEPVVETVTLPAVAGQHDTNATVTGLTAFVNCPREYYLSRYLGFERRPRGDGASAGAAELSAAELGSEVHALLAGEAVPEPHPDAQRLAEVFRRSPLGRRAARAARTGREFDFLMAVEDLVIRGQIDLWFEEAGELVIVDYKTDAVDAGEAKARAEHYQLQLRLYAMAVEQLEGRRPDRAYLHFLRPNTIVEIDLRPGLFGSPEEIVRDFLDAQSRQDFPMKITPQCPRCPHYRTLCPADSPARQP
jgi:ATP-dependent helicase/nuclease subunit A